MAPNDEDLFNIADFESIGVSVFLQNKTTQTGVQDDNRLLGEATFQLDAAQSTIKLMEYTDETISLDVPTRTGAIGHTMDCTIDVKGVILPFCFKVRARVIKLTPLDENRDRMDLELIEFEPRYFDALKNIFARRQGEIDEFLKRMRA